jgi:tetratricopeptide (TPR) repeat protein
LLGDDLVTDGLMQNRTIGSLAFASLLILSATAGQAHAFYSLRTPVGMELTAKSELAEGSGDREAAIAWAESLAVIEPTSSFTLSRVARLHEEMGEDAIALDWGNRALAADSLNADAAMLVGRMALRSGQSAVAVQALTPPLRQLGAAPELYALRALAHELERNYEPALADLKRTGVLLPDFAWIATGILSLALEDGRLEEAYSALQLALELKPEDTRTLQLGVALAQRLGDPVLEENLLRTLALLADARPEDIAGYGAFLVQAGRDRQFDMLLDWAADRGVSRDELRIDTGKALIQTGGYHQAIATVKPLRRDPRAVPIRARAYLLLGDERKALEDYRTLIPARGLSREESLMVAYLEIRVGDRKQGIRTLDQVRESPLDGPRQVLAASLCYSLLGRPEETVALIRESAARGVVSPSIYQELGSAATALGDSLLAQWAWERLRDSGQETSECLYFLSSTELAQGDLDKAVHSLDRAIQLNPKNGRALLLMGTIQSQRGQLEMARATLIRSAQCPESAAQANRLLAQVCRRLRLDSEAREAESRAHESRPRPPSGLSFFQAH